MKKLYAEGLGTFFLVFLGVSCALFSGAGVLSISLAFGLTVMVMAYTLGPISGCHLNPAVTVGLTVAGRFDRGDVLGYVIAQLVGGALGAGLVYCIANGSAGADAMVASGFASNGFGEHSPGGFTLRSVLVAEIVATALFVMVILAATSSKVPAGFAPIAIGLTLTLAHLAIINVSNASLNPARSIATALVAKGWAMDQVWLFVVAPLAGGVLGGFIHNKIAE